MLPPRHTAPSSSSAIPEAKMPAKVFYARFLLLESLVIALAGSVLPRGEQERKNFIDELKRDAEAQAKAMGHEQIVDEVEGYGNSLFAAIVHAADN